jgi:hypothetical protein
MSSGAAPNGSLGSNGPSGSLAFDTKILRRVKTGRFVQCGSVFIRATSLQDLREQLANLLPAPFFALEDYCFVTRERTDDPKPFIYQPDFWKGTKGGGTSA